MPSDSSTNSRSNSSRIARCTATRTKTIVTAFVPRTTTVTQRSRRNRSVANRPLSRSKGIAASPHGVDQGLLGPATLQLGAQAVDVDLDDVGRPLPVRGPQLLAQHLARDDL